MKPVYYLLSIMFLFFSCTDQKHSSADQTNFDRDTTFQTRNIIIAVIDGPRYSETWGDSTHQHIPHMAKDMAREGLIFTNFYNEGYTNTNSGHTTLTTGYRQLIDNTGKELPKYPSIFQYYLHKTGRPQSDAWIITSKGKLDILSNTTDSDWKNKFRPSTNCGISGTGVGYRDDGATFNIVKATLKKHKPHLMIINFKEPDASGHANNWSNYLYGIRDSDKYVWELWKLIQSDNYYKDKTTFFVTNDHGRHLDEVADGFVSHGCSCEGCRHINLYAYGPDFKKNMTVQNKYTQQDLTATAAYLLHLEMPHLEGKVIEEIFK